MSETPVVLANVTKRFGSTTALDSVSWSPRRGEITALVGLNGAGKSTLMRVMTGLVRSTEGSVTVAPASGRRALSALIEAPALFNGLTARRNLQIHRLLTGADPQEVDEVAELAQITDVLRRRVGTLSQGYRQRVSIAVALLGRPDMLLLDEPTNALDPQAVAHLRVLIRRIADRGTATVVSSHLLRELEGSVDSLTVLHDGRVLYDGAIESFVGADRLCIRAVDSAANLRLAELLRHAGIPVYLTERDVQVPVEAGADARARLVFSTASAAGIDLVELSHISQTLEDAFHNAISGAHR